MNTEIYLADAIITPHKLIKRLPCSAPQCPPIRWLYLGSDYLRLRRWENDLGSGFERISYAEQLQEIALQQRQPFLEWVAARGQENNNLVWWSSLIAERSIAVPNSLFVTICYILVAQRIIPQSTTPILIVAENSAVLRTLATMPALKPAIRHQFFPNKWFEWISWSIETVRNLVLYCWHSFRIFQAAHATRDPTYKFPLTTNRKRIVIHSCLDESYFGANGQAHDRYFTQLPELLRQRGYDVVTMPWLYNIKRSYYQAFAWFRQQSHQYIIPEDFYTVSDYLWSAWIIFQQVKLPIMSQKRLAGIDLSHLVQEMCWRQSVNFHSAKFVRYYRLVKKLAQLGVQLDVYLDMFENMVNEKPIVMALHQYLPQVTTVSFQHYMAGYPLWLNMYTTPLEQKFVPHPQFIVCNSPWTAQLFARNGFPREKLRVGPSLRYLHLKSHLPLKLPDMTGYVLVIIPLNEDVATELFHKLFEAFPIDQGIHFWLKPHPMMTETEWRTLLSKTLPTYMEKVGGKIEDWMEQASCAIVAASTSAFEIALTGTPVVLVGRETTLDLNPLGWFSELPSPVRTPTQLRNRVLRLIDLNHPEHEQWQNWARQMGQDCLSPVTEETIRVFVDPTCNNYPFRRPFNFDASTT